jgi:basic membrane lipoprotein Med (substrate-binding protein (PBP1-ABC) superfamily)
VYVIWYDSNGYDKAPGTVLGSTAILQDEAAYEKTKAAIEGEITFGEARIVGVEDGWIRFLDEDPLYAEHVPEEIRSAHASFVEKMERGELSFPMR